MGPGSAGSVRPVVHALVNAEITHVVGIPDNTSGPLFDVLERAPAIRLVTTSREGEAIALATGLWLGGARPLVVIQNTGLLESGDALRGTAQRMGAPVPLVITGRGYAKMRAAGLTPAPDFDAETLARPDVDSTALVTEPTLSAWSVPFARCDETDDPAAGVAATIAEARRAERPVALVLARSLLC